MVRIFFSGSESGESEPSNIDAKKKHLHSSTLPSSENGINGGIGTPTLGATSVATTSAEATASCLETSSISSSSAFGPLSSTRSENEGLISSNEDAKARSNVIESITTSDISTVVSTATATATVTYVSSSNVVANAATLNDTATVAVEVAGEVDVNGVVSKESASKDTGNTPMDISSSSPPCFILNNEQMFVKISERTTMTNGLDEVNVSHGSSCAMDIDDNMTSLQPSMSANQNHIGTEADDNAAPVSNVILSKGSSLLSDDIVSIDPSIVEAPSTLPLVVDSEKSEVTAAALVTKNSIDNINSSTGAKLEKPRKRLRRGTPPLSVSATGSASSSAPVSRSSSPKLLMTTPGISAVVAKKTTGVSAKVLSVEQEEDIKANLQRDVGQLCWRNIRRPRLMQTSARRHPVYVGDVDDVYEEDDEDDGEGIEDDDDVGYTIYSGFKRHFFGNRRVPTLMDLPNHYLRQHDAELMCPAAAKTSMVQVSRRKDLFTRLRGDAMLLLDPLVAQVVDSETLWTSKLEQLDELADRLLEQRREDSSTPTSNGDTEPLTNTSEELLKNGKIDSGVELGRGARRRAAKRRVCKEEVISAAGNGKYENGVDANKDLNGATEDGSTVEKEISTLLGEVRSLIRSNVERSNKILMNVEASRSVAKKILDYQTLLKQIVAKQYITKL